MDRICIRLSGIYTYYIQWKRCGNPNPHFFKGSNQLKRLGNPDPYLFTGSNQWKKSDSDPHLFKPSIQSKRIGFGSAFGSNQLQKSAFVSRIRPIKNWTLIRICSQDPTNLKESDPDPHLFPLSNQLTKSDAGQRTKLAIKGLII